jgi:hypothetical protein
MLLVSVVLKPVPIILTVSPTAPFIGVNEVIIGACANIFVLVK